MREDTVFIIVAAVVALLLLIAASYFALSLLGLLINHWFLSLIALLALFHLLLPFQVLTLLRKVVTLSYPFRLRQPYRPMLFQFQTM